MWQLCLSPSFPPFSDLFLPAPLHWRVKSVGGAILPPPPPLAPPNGQWRREGRFGEKGKARRWRRTAGQGDSNQANRRGRRRTKTISQHMLSPPFLLLRTVEEFFWL